MSGSVVTITIAKVWIGPSFEKHFNYLGVQLMRITFASNV